MRKAPYLWGPARHGLQHVFVWNIARTPPQGFEASALISAGSRNNAYAWPVYPLGLVGFFGKDGVVTWEPKGVLKRGFEEFFAGSNIAFVPNSGL